MEHVLLGYCSMDGLNINIILRSARQAFQLLPWSDGYHAVCAMVVYVNCLWFQRESPVL